MRQYETRERKTGAVVKAFEAQDRNAANALIAKDYDAFVNRMVYVDLVRLANDADGAEKAIWVYPPDSRYENGVCLDIAKGLGSEDEDY